MNTRRFLQAAVALCVSIALCATTFALWYTGVLFRFGIARCTPPPSLAVDGYAAGTAIAWLDTDRDGELDPSESPLEGVTVHLWYETGTTDVDGRASVSLFRPGCACDCNAGYSISADPPSGLRLTTPSEYALQETPVQYMFGFAE